MRSPSNRVSLAALADAVSVTPPTTPTLVELLNSSASCLRKFGMVHGLMPIPVAQALELLEQAIARVG
jgi:hypothetical protein